MEAQVLLDAAGLHGPEAVEAANWTGEWWCPCMMGFGFMGGFMGLLWMILIIVIIAAVIYAVIGIVRGLQQPPQYQPQYASDEIRRLREEIEELKRELRRR